MKHIQRLLGVPFTWVLSAPVAWAQFEIGIKASDVGLPESNQDLPEIILRIVNYTLGLVAVIALAFIVYGGFRYIMSRGDDKEVQAAKNTIVYAVIGIVMIGLAAVLVQFVIGALFEGGGTRPGSSAGP